MITKTHKGRPRLAGPGEKLFISKSFTIHPALLEKAKQKKGDIPLSTYIQRLIEKDLAGKK
jgi:hypothetical protein